MLHSSQQLLVFCIALICGLIGFQIVEIPYMWFAAGLVLFFLKGVPARLCALVCMAFLLAGWRVSLIQPFENTYDEFVQVEAVVVQEPQLREYNQRVLFEAEGVDGLLQVSAPLHPRFEVGQRVQLSCVLEKPEAFDGFAYDKYLQRYGVGALCSYPGVEVLGVESSWQSWLAGFRGQVMAAVRHSLPQPENTLLLGALFGVKRAVPEAVDQYFRATGTSHILVISGLHVSLVSSMVSQVLLRFPVSRNGRIAVVLVFLLSFVVFTGFQVSAIRASLFGAAALVALLLGRVKHSLRVLLLVATGMLLHNPLLLLYDVGFQLSFAATGGIILYQRWFEGRLQVVPATLGIRGGLATSLAAILTTSPIIAHSFGQFSLVAPIANVVVVPLVPLMLVGGIGLSVFATLLPPISAIVAVPLYALLHGVIDIVEWFGRLSFASVVVPEHSWVYMFAAITVVIIIGFHIYGKEE